MNSARIHAVILAFVSAASLTLNPVCAMDTPTPEPKNPKDPAMEQARAAIGKQDWMGAQKILREAVARNPQDADSHNLYAYSMRKGDKPAMDLVFRHYNEALRLDPKHRAAHEYLGEAYLMSGNVAKAKEHLAQLDNLCTFGCEEYTRLKKEVAAYEQQHAKK
jgi:cytochrome c-type biogenesis protein CcmH/NrfG